MNWQDLIAEITAVGSSGSSAQPITGIEYDSRRVRPGRVFVAMKGGSTDGNRYIDKAIAAGAHRHHHRLLAYLRSPAGLSSPDVAVAEVEHGRRALAEASAAFFGHPERMLAATGITGTNGKTTTAFLTEALFNAAARKTVLIGTIEYHVAGEVRQSLHTTPESRDLFRADGRGCEPRCDRTGHRSFKPCVSTRDGHTVFHFDVAVFTNLTRDHLDYHQTMEKYFAAKRLLFDGTVYPAPRVAVINAHDAADS